MLEISPTIVLADDEVEFTAIRSQGPGGQNVNKVSTGVQLRFDIQGSSLPERVKERLRQRRDRRVTKDGIVVIKAQQFRVQEKNREAAGERLAEMIRAALFVPKKRRPTRPNRGAKERRLRAKRFRGALKAQRGKVEAG